MKRTSLNWRYTVQFVVGPWNFVFPNTIQKLDSENKMSSPSIDNNSERSDKCLYSESMNHSRKSSNQSTWGLRGPAAVARRRSSPRLSRVARAKLGSYPPRSRLTSSRPCLVPCNMYCLIGLGCPPMNISRGKRRQWQQPLRLELWPRHHFL